jgi:G:T-mismatch repair DNA endonuclease (very short patch repair protein)
VTFKKGQIPWNKGRTPPPEEVERLRLFSANRRGKCNSPEHRARISQSRRGQSTRQSKEAARKRSQSLKRRLAIDVNLRIQRIAQLTELNKSERRRREVSKQARAQWGDNEFRNRVARTIAEALQRKPNKPERTLGGILERHFLGEWEYTGDGFHIIGGFAPDFTNSNGLKAVIELFGIYWHGKRARRWTETELGRVMAYNALGFRCLVIWDHELDDEDAVVEKVKVFLKK